MSRWTIHDLVVGDTYTVEYNPNTMTTPHADRQTGRNPRSGIDGKVRSIRPNVQPYEWAFGGFIRSQAHLQGLLTWALRGNMTEITDHVGRVWKVRPVLFDEQEVKPSAKTPWKFNYQVRCLMYGRVS